MDSEYELFLLKCKQMTFQFWEWWSNGYQNEPPTISKYNTVYNIWRIFFQELDNKQLKDVIFEWRETHEVNSTPV